MRKLSNCVAVRGIDVSFKDCLPCQKEMLAQDNPDQNFSPSIALTMNREQYIYSAPRNRGDTRRANK